MNYIKWIQLCFHWTNESNRVCKNQTKEEKKFSEEAFYSFRDLIVCDETLEFEIMKDYTRGTVVLAISKNVWLADTRRLKNNMQKKKDSF